MVYGTNPGQPILCRSTHRFSAKHDYQTEPMVLGDWGSVNLSSLFTSHTHVIIYSLQEISSSDSSQSLTPSHSFCSSIQTPLPHIQRPSAHELSCLGGQEVGNSSLPSGQSSQPSHRENSGTQVLVLLHVNSVEISHRA